MQVEYFKAERLLKKYGINSIRSAYVSSVQEALRFRDNHNLVLKVLSEKVVHKAKQDLVRLNLSDEDEVRKAFKELTAAAKRFFPYRIIAQQMSGGGVEAIIGGKDDPQFGKLILIGLGGVYTNAFKDFALRLCPITKYDSLSMLSQLRSCDVITHEGRALPVLTALLLKVSKLLSDNPAVKELDLNPVIVRKNSYDVVDIRVVE